MKIKGLALFTSITLFSALGLAGTPVNLVRTLNVKAIVAASPEGFILGSKAKAENNECLKRYGRGQQYQIGEPIAVSDYQLGAVVGLPSGSVNLHPSLGDDFFISDGAANSQTGLQLVNLVTQGSAWKVQAVYPSDPSDVAGHSYTCVMIAQ